MKVDKDRAYFLHSKPFRENTLLAQLFTESHGLVNFLVSGIKPSKSATISKRALLQPCQPLSIDYQLKPNLSKLTHIESLEILTPLPHEHFMFYQYVHELLLILLPSQLPLPSVFKSYENCLALFREQQAHYALRQIEIALIEHFSGLPYLQHALDSSCPIDGDKYYFYLYGKGLYENGRNSRATRFTGQQILAFNHLVKRQQTPNKEINEILAKGAQTITTFFISQLLNGKKLKTRNIYLDLQYFK